MLMGSTGPMLLTYTAASITVGLTEIYQKTDMNLHRTYLLTDVINIYHKVNDSKEKHIPRRDFMSRLNVYV